MMVRYYELLGRSVEKWLVFVSLATIFVKQKKKEKIYKKMQK